MKWIDKMLLFVLGVILVAQLPIDSVSIAAVVSAFSVGCLGGYSARRVVWVVICVLWTALSLAVPVFCLFWPLVFYDAAMRKAYPVAVLPVVCIVVNHAAFAGVEIVAMAFGLAISLVMGMREDSAATARREVRDIRDAYRETNLMLDRKNKELLAVQDSGMRIATLTERGRIAREIHDNVGHMLARAMLQTGAAIAVSKDEEAKENLEGIRETLDQAMDSVRRSVHDLRDEAFDLYGIVQSCANDFPVYECNLNYDMSSTAPINVQYCFAAVVREAFANVQKHSDATRIRIDIQEHPAFYRLHFQDNGTYRNVVKKTGETGMGLHNMRDRAEALGGRIHIDDKRGFGILIIVPRQERD